MMNDPVIRRSNGSYIIVWEEIAAVYNLVNNQIVDDPLFNEIKRKCVEYGLWMCRIRMEKPIS